MPAIVVDYSKIVKNNKYKPPKNIKGKIGLVLVIDNTTLQNLKNVPLGKKRVEYFNSEQFSTRVKAYYFISYENDKNVIHIPPIIYEQFDSVLNSIFSGFSHVNRIVVSIPIKEQNFIKLVKQFSMNGFAHPHIKNEKLQLSRLNKPTNRIDPDSILHQIKYVLEQSKNQTCGINIQFTNNAIKFLRKASKIGITVNGNGKKSQKELTGELHVSKVMKMGDKIVYKIDLDERSVGSGSEEDVDVSPTRYNFHSHPEEAYVRHSVDKAWPSLTDYLGYLTLGNNTICHTVATLEGLYVMSFGPYWVNHLDKISKDFVHKNYDIDHKEKYTPFQYAEKVSKIKYKGYPIYIVQYIKWKDVGKVIHVNFAKTDNTCVAVEDDKLHI